MYASLSSQSAFKRKTLNLSIFSSELSNQESSHVVLASSYCPKVIQVSWLFSKIKIYLRQHSFKISSKLVFDVCSIDFSRQEENLVEPVCEVEQKKPEVDIYERLYLFCKIFLVRRILKIFWRHCTFYTRFLGDSLVH